MVQICHVKIYAKIEYVLIVIQMIVNKNQLIHVIDGDETLMGILFVMRKITVHIRQIKIKKIHMEMPNEMLANLSHFLVLYVFLSL